VRIGLHISVCFRCLGPSAEHAENANAISMCMHEVWVCAPCQTAKGVDTDKLLSLRPPKC
jgi:hypothetical protein